MNVGVGNQALTNDRARASTTHSMTWDLMGSVIVLSL